MADPLLQHILHLVSTFGPSARAPVTPPVWDGIITDQTDAVLNAINALGVRCQQAEADLDTIQREHPNICAPSRRKLLNDSAVNSVMDTIAKTNATGGPCGCTEETGRAVIPLSTAGAMNNVELELVAGREEIKALKKQIHDVTRVCIAIERGDLDQEVEIEAEGEMLQLKLALNGLLDFLPSVLSEVSRVFLEIGVEGMYGGQAVPRQGRGELKGCWASFVTLMNYQAASLTDQSRSLADALEKAASGDFTSRMADNRWPPARGEALGLQRVVTDLLRWMRAEALMEQSE